MEKLEYNVRVRLLKKDLCFGPGVAELMELVRQYESLTEACRVMGMAYSKGWKIVKRAEKVLGFSLMKGTRGGRNGGKMLLTEEGEEFLSRFRKFEEEIKDRASELFSIYFQDIDNKKEA